VAATAGLLGSDGSVATAVAACLILVGCFNDLQDHLLLYFLMVVWGLLAWIV
jgi:hypothetical protein